MGPKLFLSASLLLGQTQFLGAQEGSWFSRPGWTGGQTRTQTKSYSQTWTSSGGWVTTSGGWQEERPALFRFGDKIGSLFGRKAAPAPADDWRPVPGETKIPGRAEPLTPEERPSLVATPPAEPIVEPVAPVLAPVPAEAPAPLPRETKPATVRKTSTPIPLTPGGEFTIEVMEPDEVAEPVKPVAFDSKPANSINSRYVSRVAHAPDYASVTGQLRVVNKEYKLVYASSKTVDRMGGVLVLEMNGDLSPLQNGDLIEARGTLFTRRDGTVVYRPSVIRIVERE